MSPRFFFHKAYRKQFALERKIIEREVALLLVAPRRAEQEDRIARLAGFEHNRKALT